MLLRRCPRKRSATRPAAAARPPWKRRVSSVIPLRRFATIYKLRDKNRLSSSPSSSLYLSPLSLSPPTRVRSRCDSPVTGARARRRAAPRRAGTSVQRRKRGCTAAVAAAAAAVAAAAAAAAAARASTITIIYADGVSTLTFNVPPPPRGERSDRSPLASSSPVTARGEIMGLLRVINSRWRSEPVPIASVRARSCGAREEILIVVSRNKILVLRLEKAEMTNEHDNVDIFIRQLVSRGRFPISRLRNVRV